MYFKMIVILCVVLIVSLCGCASSKGNHKELLKENQEKQQVVVEKETDSMNKAYINYDVKNTSNEIIYENEYANPFAYSDESADEIERSLYWEMSQNGIVLSNTICKSLSDKNWENITLYNGFPQEFKDFGIYLTEQEKKSFLYTVHADVNDGMIEVFVIISLADSNLEGNISRTVYMGNGREWDPISYGYKDDEFCDAYTLELWQTAYSY